MQYRQPYLEPYKGRSSRYECPACHDKTSFARYLNGDTGDTIHSTVGRCNHESGCGYHYTPKQYYQDNPDKSDALKKGEDWQNVTKNVKVTSRASTPETPKEPGRIPKQYIIQSLGYGSNFVAFLCSLFDRFTLESPTVERLMRDYYLGCTKDKSVIFWQLDGKRIRTGKIMQYNPSTGKRIKNASGAIDWVHSKLKRDKVLPDDYNLVQCLFGEHLLRRYSDKVVALVESEKSALIAAGVYPNYIWLATGGKSQLSPDKLQVLQGRTVIMFPDADGYALWCEKAREMESNGINAIVSDILEKNASQADKDAKIDLADWLIRELRQAERIEAVQEPFTKEEQALHRLVNLNPNINTLIDTFGLVSASTGERLRTQIN